MKIYRHKVTGQYHAKLVDGIMSKGFESKEALLELLKQLQRNARRRTLDDARRDCGLVKTPYGWE